MHKHFPAFLASGVDPIANLSKPRPQAINPIIRDALEHIKVNKRLYDNRPPPSFLEYIP